MGDCNLVGKKDSVENKTVDSAAALSYEAQAIQLPGRLLSEQYSGYGHGDFACSAGRSSSRPVETVTSQTFASGQLDFDKDDVFGKKTIEKKLSGNKIQKKEMDYAPVPTLYPLVNQMFDRVDRNQDETISNREITRALDGENLNAKEKYMLETLKKNKELIDNDRNGISMRDIKEFDAKISQYNNELAISRKFAPETADLARELRQHGKTIDQNYDGKFSREELQQFYAQIKNEFLLKPTAEGKQELQALGWGIANFERFTGRTNGGEITPQSLQLQALREMDRELPREFRQNFLSASDRYRVERYQQSR
ncbi:MAG: hypothetical protein DKT66_18000 [Candidatus Melainabacteria bacterium]|nr:MAG: hypothetical protein DKT66_18000 [Candidatus Melainabacteria bacterium]